MLANAFDTEHASIWTVSVLGGKARLLRDDAWFGSVSPDGLRVAFGENASINGAVARELWLMGAEGEEPHRLVGVDESSWIGSFVWSPNGQRVAYIRSRQATGETSLESRDLSRRTTCLIVSDPNLTGPCCDQFCWLPDGRIIYTMNEAPPNADDTNFWEVRVDNGSGKTHQQT